MRRMIRNRLKEGRHNEGFPQGGAMSPILTIFNKENSVFSLLDHIMYADDGLLLDIIEDFEPEELNNEENGLEINKEKSG
jgi:hypothetical protein